VPAGFGAFLTALTGIKSLCPTHGCGRPADLAARRGYLMWMFRPVHGGIWAEVADDATPAATAPHPRAQLPRCPSWQRVTQDRLPASVFPGATPPELISRGASNAASPLARRIPKLRDCECLLIPCVARLGLINQTKA